MREFRRNAASLSSVPPDEVHIDCMNSNLGHRTAPVLEKCQFSLAPNIVWGTRYPNPKPTSRWKLISQTARRSSIIGPTPELAVRAPSGLGFTVELGVTIAFGDSFGGSQKARIIMAYNGLNICLNQQGAKGQAELPFHAGHHIDSTMIRIGIHSLHSQRNMSRLQACTPQIFLPLVCSESRSPCSFVSRIVIVIANPNNKHLQYSMIICSYMGGIFVVTGRGWGWSSLGGDVRFLLKAVHWVSTLSRNSAFTWPL